MTDHGRQEDRRMDARSRLPYEAPSIRSLTARQVVEALGHASALYGGEEFGGRYGED